jgi:hypothetical protein
LHAGDETWFDEHTRLQAPQLAGSAKESTSQPLNLFPSQSENPCAQVMEAQSPAMHDLAVV